MKIIQWIILIFIGFRIISLLFGTVDNYKRVKDIRDTLKEKSYIEISADFEILEDEVVHTPGAFDSDYTWSPKIKINATDFESVCHQIEHSRFYNPKDPYSITEERIDDSLKIYGLKGFWRDAGEEYEFHPSREAWAEMTYITISKKDTTIDIVLIHL